MLKSQRTGFDDAEDTELFKDPKSRIDAMSRTFFRYPRYPNGRQSEIEEATTTIPTLFATRLFSQFGVLRGSAERPYYNSTISVKIPQPVVTTRCLNNWYAEAWDTIKYPQDGDTSVGILGSLESWAQRPMGTGVHSFNTLGLARITFQPLWVPSPEKDSHSLLGVFFSSASSTETTLQQLLEDSKKFGKDQHNIAVHCCSITAFWKTGETKSIVDGSQSNLMVGFVQTDKITAMESSNSRPISLNLSGLDMPSHAQFASMIGNSSYTTGLARAFALALAEVPTNVIESQSPEKWSNLKSSKENVDAILVSTIWAYGYSADSTAIRLSIAVFLAYCLIVVTYMVYILTTGCASTTWNSAIEVVALALQSRNPKYPNHGHFAAGIDSLSTLRQDVGIRVNKDNELELIFANDRDLDYNELRKIEKNKAY